MSQRETIIQAMQAALSGIAVTVLRNSDVPEQVPDSGLVIIRDGVCEIEDAVLGSVKSWYMRLNVPLEIYVSTQDPDLRALHFDDLANQAYIALVSDANLGTLVNHIEPIILEIETLSGDGMQSLQAATLNIALEYDAATSIG